MISRKLASLLVVSTGLAWLSLPDTLPFPPDHRIAATVSDARSISQSAIPTQEPWQRLIELPATETPPPVEPELVIEPIVLAEVEPPPPPLPTAPPLPMQYLGRLQQDQSIVLFVRYQEQPYRLRPGERLTTDYRLERVAADHALFRYLPMNELQELRWDD